jgi:hypothetical protein
MRPTAVRLVLAALLVATVAAAAPAGTAETPPSVTLTVDGETLADGGSTLVATDPDARVRADADTPIREVAVRLDGTTVHRATPNATSVDTTVDLDVQSGDHTLTVVVKAETVTTHEVTITKDAERPYVRYTAPFETEQYAPPPETVTVNRTRVTLRGNFTDVTGVTHLRIRRTTTYEVGGLSRNDTTLYTASGFNGSFAQPMFLGVGRNDLTARYYDAFGHQRVHNVTVVVDDTAPPTLSNLSAVRRSADTLRIRGVATDNGQLRNVSVQARTRSSAGSRSETRLLAGGWSARPSRDRLRHEFDRNVSLYPGVTAVVVSANDTAGNTVERVVTVRRTVDPDLRLDPTATRFANEETVVARGRATDGEIASATVETVDPDTGEVVDIVTLHDGAVVTDLSFERRLDAPDGRDATIRLRVVDSAGTEHVRSVDRRLSVETQTATPTQTATATPAPTPTPTATPAPTPTATPAPDGVTVPLIGVTIPIPSVFGAAVSVPVPFVGPFDVPIVPAAGLAVVGLGAAARAR